MTVNSPAASAETRLRKYYAKVLRPAQMDGYCDSAICTGPTCADAWRNINGPVKIIDGQLPGGWVHREHCAARVLCDRGGSDLQITECAAGNTMTVT